MEMMNAPVSKGTNIRDYNYLPENVRSWAEPVFEYRNPVSPLQMLASGMLMARGYAEINGKKLSNKQAKKYGRSVDTMAQGRMQIFSPVGRGSVF